MWARYSWRVPRTRSVQEKVLLDFVRWRGACTHSEPNFFCGLSQACSSGSLALFVSTYEGWGLLEARHAVSRKRGWGHQTETGWWHKRKGTDCRLESER